LPILQSLQPHTGLGVTGGIVIPHYTIDVGFKASSRPINIVIALKKSRGTAGAAGFFGLTIARRTLLLFVFLDLFKIRIDNIFFRGGIGGRVFPRPGFGFGLLVVG